MPLQTDETNRHEVRLLDRKHLEITGVHDVVSFDQSHFRIVTVMGAMLIRGQNLHLQTLQLDRKLLHIDGEIHELKYVHEHDKGNASGWLRKVLK